MLGRTIYSTMSRQVDEYLKSDDTEVRYRHINIHAKDQ